MSFNYAEDHRKLKRVIIEAKKSSAMQGTISYLNAQIFGGIVNSAGDNPDGGEDEAVDELDELLEGFAFDEDEEAPPTVVRPHIPRDLTEAAPFSRAPPLSRSPSPVPSRTAKVAAGSSTHRVAQTADVTPPVPKKAPTKVNKSKRPPDSDTVSGAAPAKGTRKTRSVAS